MRHDGEDKRNAREQPSAVGYKKPPREHRFQKGRSGNPRGRPRKKTAPTATHSTSDVEALMLEEAYRPVSIREGDKVIQLPTIQAVMRGLGVAAIKGNHRAQLAFKEHTQAIETKKLAEKQQLFEAMAEHKWKWESEFERFDRLGLPRPDPVPHPDDIQLDDQRGEARCVGPFDDRQKHEWNDMRVHREDFVKIIENLKILVSQYPRLKKNSKERIQIFQNYIEAIDYYYPDEATRRHPLYDPYNRGERPDLINIVASAKPVARATKAAGRRRSKAPEE